MHNKISAILFIIYILVFAVGFWILPDRAFSDVENRNLTLLPKFSVKSLLDGTYTEEFESYMADQVILKDVMVSLKVDTVKAVGQRLINGVFFGEDDYLIQQYQMPGEQLDKNIGYVQAFAQKTELPITFLIVPNASQIYQEKMPAFTSCYDQNLVIDKLQTAWKDELTLVDATDVLMAHKDEKLYYQTDHHWNMLGAYYGYEKLCEALEVTPKALADYRESVVAEDFYGSMYSKAPSAFQKADTMMIYENPAGAYQVTYAQDNKVSDALFVKENLKKKDKYTLFLDGNHPLLTIQSNGEVDEKVLVLKDSYAHIMLPFLADTYQELHVMDLRYYHGDIETYMAEHEIDRVIFIHNVDFVSSDINFVWLD